MKYIEMSCRYKEPSFLLNELKKLAQKLFTLHNQRKINIKRQIISLDDDYYEDNDENNNDDYDAD